MLAGLAVYAVLFFNGLPAAMRMPVAAYVLVLSTMGAVSLMLETQPPYELLQYEAPAAHPGGVLHVEARVKRDLSRPCSVVFSRHIFDSQGTRHDIVAATSMTVAAVRGLEKAAPGRLVLAVQLPPYIPLGKAQLVTPLSYTCNAWHTFKPIEETMVIDFEVTP
jgi:hypothetical protein